MSILNQRRLSPEQNQIGRNLVILVVGEGLSRIIYAIAFIHITRVFTPDQYGLIELILAVLMVLMIVVDLGLGVIGTREIAKDNEQTDHLVRDIVSMQFGLAIFIVAALTLTMMVLPVDRLLAVLMIGFGISLLAYPLNLNWVFQGWNRMSWVTIPQIVRQLVFAVLVFAFIHTPDQILILPLIEIVSVAFLAIINFWAYLRYEKRFRIDLSAAWRSKLYRMSIPVGASQLIWALRMYFPTILLAGLAGKSSVGFFGAPHRVVMVLQGLLIVYFVNLLPNLSLAFHQSRTNFIDLIRKSMKFLIWPSILFAAGVSILSRQIIDWLFGQLYVLGNTSTILAILVWILPVLVWRSHGRNSLVVLNWQQEEMICSLIGLAALICLAIPLSLLYKGIGTSLAMLVSELAATILIWWRVRRHLPEIGIPDLFFQLPSASIFYDSPRIRKP